eukprot:g4359.t1
MPLHVALGKAVRQEPVDLTARWVMSYAAGIGDDTPAFTDTTGPEVVEAHPCLYWALSWPLNGARFREFLAAPLEVSEVTRGAMGIHYGEDCVIYRPMAAGDRISTPKRTYVDYREDSPRIGSLNL